MTPTVIVAARRDQAVYWRDQMESAGIDDLPDAITLTEATEYMRLGRYEIHEAYIVGQLTIEMIPFLSTVMRPDSLNFLIHWSTKSSGMLRIAANLLLGIGVSSLAEMFPGGLFRPAKSKKSYQVPRSAGVKSSLTVPLRHSSIHSLIHFLL